MASPPSQIAVLDESEKSSSHIENGFVNLDDSNIESIKTSYDDKPLGLFVPAMDVKDTYVATFYNTYCVPIAAGSADYFGLGIICPLLPYWLEYQNEKKFWVGAIQTVQYFGVLCGSLIFGRIADLRGRKFAIQIALSGDVILFFGTGLAPDAIHLCIVRFLVGCFTPLVSSIAWANDAGQGDPILTGKIMSSWAMTMSLAFLCGGIVGGLMGYKLWFYEHLICSIIAFFSLIFVSTQEEPPRSDKKVKPQGLDVVIRSSEFISLCALQFMVGVSFTGNIVVSTLIASHKLQINASETSFIFAGIALYHIIENIVWLPYILNRYNGSPVVAMNQAILVTLVSYVALCFNATYDADLWLIGFLLVTASTLIPVCMTGANILAANYAARYSVNSKGATLGISRLWFNLGQMFGPLIAVGFYELGTLFFYLAFITMTCIFYLPWSYYHKISTNKIMSEKNEKEAKASEIYKSNMLKMIH
jgi:MFS family permease